MSPRTCPRPLCRTCQRVSRQLTASIACLTLSLACGDAPATGGTSASASAAAKAVAAKPAAAKKPQATPSATAASVTMPKVNFQEEDFAESERSRDPFRAYSEVFVQTGERRSIQKQAVVLEQYALEDLKLVGIVTGIEPARAMLVDPTGQGHVIHRNDLVGRAERVQGGATAADLEINWRVERIRDSDVVLVREDPSNPDVPSATRVLALRPEEQK
jgi:type IV pilus assembly protein PilP